MIPNSMYECAVSTQNVKPESKVAFDGTDSLTSIGF